MTREEKMNKRREAGKTYKYKPNTCPKGTREYYDEKYVRSLKKTTSNKTPFARWTSVMAKLENQLEAERKASKEKKEAKKSKKS